MKVRNSPLVVRRGNYLYFPEALQRKKRNHEIKSVLSKKEMDEVKDKANKCGLNVSSFTRMCVLISKIKSEQPNSMTLTVEIN